MSGRKGAAPLLSVLLRILLVLVLIPALLLGALTVHYLLTIRAPGDFLPARFMVYLQVPALREVYDNLLDLEAGDIIFSTPEMAPVRSALTEFKSRDIARSPLLGRLLEVRLDFMALEDFSPLLVFDLGWRSIFTRAVPLLGPYLSVKQLSFINEEGLRLFRYGAADAAVYLHFRDNLALASTDPRVIRSALEARGSGNHFNGRRDLGADPARQAPPGGGIRIVFETDAFLAQIARGAPDAKVMLDRLAFPEPTVVTLWLSNEECTLEAATAVEARDESLAGVLAYRPPSLSALRLLPEETGVYSSINLADFRDLVALFLEIQGEDARRTVQKADNASRLLLGLSLDELLFSWTGSEAGAFTLGSAADPVLFVRIRDERAFTRAMDSLHRSLVVNVDSSLVLDGVRVNRIALPGFLKGIVDLFQKGLETPYYIVQGDTLFLSMNPQNLSRLSSGLRANRLLVGSRTFSSLTGGSGIDARILLYYDLNRSVPFFLNNESLVAEILKLYGRGIAAVRLQDGRVRVDVRARRMERQGTVPYPGFPRPLEVALSGDVVPASFGGSGLARAVYADREGGLHVSDLAGGGTLTARCEKGVTPVPGRGQAIFAWTPEGSVFRIDGQAKTVAPFPMVADLRGSFPPILQGDRLVYYSRSARTLVFLDPAGNSERWADPLANHLLSAPAVRDGWWAFYPKSFSGEVYLTNADGRTAPGWPARSDGISYCSPGLVQSTEGLAVVFLTQRGTLHAWDLEGVDRDGFPVSLPGVFYADPAYPRLSPQAGEGILTLSDKGQLTLLDLGGRVLQERTVEDLDGKSARLLAFDMDRDGSDELFVYGDKNFILGFDLALRTLPGFPVRGSQKPFFTDINADGIPEMVAGSYDNHLYAYTLRK